MDKPLCCFQSMSLLFGGLLVVFLASPVAAAGAEDTDLIVQLEVDLPAQEVELVDPSAFPVRVEPGETVGLTIRVFDSEDHNTPVVVEDSSELVEIRDTTGANTPLRFADMSEGPRAFTPPLTHSARRESSS